MKEVSWPKDGSPASFSDLTEPIRKIVRHCYSIQRKNKNKDVDWKGLELPECMSATCLTFDEKLKADNLKYEKEDQGRSAMDVIISIAVQLGIEQGRRMYKQEIMHELTYLQLYSDSIARTLLNLQDKQMVKFLKKYPYIIAGSIGLIFLSIGVGMANNMSDGLTFFGVTMAISTLWVWIINET